ncbi:MAG: hypothetical protein Q7R54_00065 [bacterium]|nr:hypothetical protein [bacterium]
MSTEPKISFDDFKKVEITVGRILSAEKVPETDKLLKLSVDFGLSPLEKGVPPSSAGRDVTPSGLEDSTTSLIREDTPTPVRDVRQIVSGIAMHFPEPQVLVGKKCMFVTNLEPRMIKGLESNGMLFAVSTEDGKFSLLEPNTEIPEGTNAK